MQRFKNILCVVTPDSNNEATLARGIVLANNNQASLTVIEIIDEIPPNTKLLNHILSSEDLQAKMVTEHQKKLEKLVASQAKNIEIQTKVGTGTPFLETIREVLQNQRDLVIKTAESGGPLDRLFGSDDMHLLRKCPCPVWLVKSTSSKSYRCILAAVDVDSDYPPEELSVRLQLNLQVLEMASALALSELAELHIVHAWEAAGEKAMRRVLVDTPEENIIAYIEAVRQQHSRNLNTLMNETINRLGQSAMEYLTPQVHLLKGPARKKIPAIADKIETDLIIMGTVARTGIPGLFMGNTAETILNRLDCSVLAIKPSGFITPVTLERAS